MSAVKTTKGLLGTKLGMTQVWDENNKLVPVTVVQITPNVVTQVRSIKKDGYEAVQIAYGQIDPRKVNKPANCPGVISVAGLRHAGTKNGFSSLGPEVSIAAPAGNCVNLSGECLYPILSTSNTGTTTPSCPTHTTGGSDAAVGTSFAAPLVSGTAALMLAANPALTPAQVLSLLKSSARGFPSSGAGVGVSSCVAGISADP